MALPQEIIAAKGSWSGKNKLHQSWLAPEKQVSESVSNLHVDMDSRSLFATITYTWQYEGKREEGTLIIVRGAKSHVVQMAWVDTWHENSEILHLVGAVSDGVVKAKGTYQAGTETWGWTISLATAKDTLTMKMENVTPAGQADWAVEAVYVRA